MVDPAGDPEEGTGATSGGEAEVQFALEENDGGLPWLEDSDLDADEGAFDARLIWLALGGLLVIGGVLAGAWWLLRDGPTTEAVPDGSTIAAPAEPYKQRPADPGGRQVEGTGDTAYQVAEGNSQRGRMGAGSQEAPRPGIDLAQSGRPRPTASNSAGAADGPGEDDKVTPASGSVYVQIGAFASRADADAAWSSATGRYSVLSGMSHRVVEAEVNGATVYRLQAIAGDRAGGEATCRAIRNAGGDCYLR